MTKPLRSRAQLQARLRAKPSKASFQSLYGALCEAEQAGVPELREWIALSAQALESWPDALRELEWRVDPDAEGADRFLSRSHPLYTLPRSLCIEEDSQSPLNDYLDALFQAPDVGRLRRLSLCWFGSAPSAQDLARWFAPARGLQSLTLYFSEFTDAFGEALADCEGLASLVELNLSGHRLSPQGLQALSEAPLLSGLKRFLIGESPGEVHWSKHPEELGQYRFTEVEALALAERMPDLEMLLAVGTRTPMGMEDWSEAPELGSQQARLDAVFAAIQDPEEPYPFDGESAVYLWLEPEECLEDVPEWQDWTRVYAFGFAAGQPVFRDGMLQAPLSFRAIARIEERPDYGGQALHQVHFAQAGLVLEQDESGVLWLHPERCTQGSDLVHFFAALRAAERAYGGRNVDFACSPWHEIMGGVVEGYGMGSIVTWPEDAHAFGPCGELLEQGQALSIRGDVFPLQAALKRVGMGLYAEGEGLVLRRLL